MRAGNLSTFLIALSVLVLFVLCAAWPRHHEQVNSHYTVDGYADSRRVCTEEMVPTLIDRPDTLAYTGVAVTEMTGIYRVIGTVTSLDRHDQSEQRGFVCAVVLRRNTTWIAKELRLI